MALALRRYRKTLYASGLIEPAELDAFERALARDRRPTTAEELNAALIAAKKLTPHQAAELAAGRTAGLVLGNYVVLDRIGAGGMGQVFKAWHRRMQRVVALKTLPDQAAAGEDSIARFRREILSAAQLSHPNIVAAYDADVSAGVHFLVMEYVDGQNLAEVVRQLGPLPPAQAVKYILDAARGLAYAHARGIVHRDVKPSNLIVDGSDVVKVLDLGLARPAALVGAELTMPGDVVGTLEYMAPEQAAGADTVDGRADVYGLGCTLYRLVTGELPYRGRSPSELIAAHRDQKIPSLRDARDEVPRSLDAVFKRMVAKQAGDRFATMDDALDALEKLRLPGRVRPVRQANFGSRLATASAAVVAPSSGDDIDLAPTAGAPLLKGVSATVDKQPVMPPVESPLESPVARPAVSPTLALLALITALAGITSLSWFDTTGVADRDRAVSPPGSATAYSSAHDWQRAWSQALGVPVSMTNSLDMRFLLVPPDGMPQDGSPVAVGTPFYYAAHELTIAEYCQFLAAAGHRTAVPRQADRHPAVDLTAADAEAFCSWLSQREGANYRLPTAAEFAHACRAGAAGRLWFDESAVDVDRYAWYRATSTSRTHQVGILEANPLGLYDILGNASEWCRAVALAGQGKAPSPNAQHVLCGGSWSSPAAELGSPANRDGTLTTATGGLRLVLDLPQEARWPRRNATAKHRVIK